jgi:hypothetical protein
MKKFTEIDSWEGICQELNMDPVASMAFVTLLPEKDQAFMSAIYMITKASEVAWDGKEPDPTDFYPVFDTDDDSDPSGFGFSHSFYVSWLTYTLVGSRLVFPSPEDAKHAGKTFLHWYRDFMIIPK